MISPASAATLNCPFLWCLSNLGTHTLKAVKPPVETKYNADFLEIHLSSLFYWPFFFFFLRGNNISSSDMSEKENKRRLTILVWNKSFEARVWKFKGIGVGIKKIIYKAYFVNPEG